MQIAQQVKGVKAVRNHLRVQRARSQPSHLQHREDTAISKRDGGSQDVYGVRY